MPPPPLELTLPRLQRWMQAVIEQPGEAAEAVNSEAARAELDPAEISRVILPSKTLSSVERVGVYQGMYLLRMVEALENDFPAVAHSSRRRRLRRARHAPTSPHARRAATR